MISLETINERSLLLSALDVWGGSGTGHLLLVLESHVWLMALCWLRIWGKVSSLPVPS